MNMSKETKTERITRLAGETTDLSATEQVQKGIQSAMDNFSPFAAAFSATDRNLTKGVNDGIKLALKPSVHKLSVASFEAAQIASYDLDAKPSKGNGASVDKTTTPTTQTRAQS